MGNVSTQPINFYGTYTPTATLVANVTAATPGVFTYMRLGFATFVFGLIQIDPTIVGSIQVDITLPVTIVNGCGGLANWLGQNQCAIVTDGTSQRARIQGVVVTAALANEYVQVCFVCS